MLNSLMVDRQTRAREVLGVATVMINGHIIIHQEEESMKSSTRDHVEGKLHQVKGKIKEVAGKIADNPELEIEGKGENAAGKVQEKAGDIKKVVGK